MWKDASVLVLRVKTGFIWDRCFFFGKEKGKRSMRNKS